ncbi:MAG: SIR2 family protein [Candidatus Aminicenantes bacterium]|jgi:tetratricopeptide (TPR) repeat protein
MGRDSILHVPGNAENLRELIAQKKTLLPFIGSGFSVPACSTWSAFLDLFFSRIKDKSLLAEEKHHYLQLKNSSAENKFEKMVDFLVEKAGRQRFEKEMSAHFDKPLLPRMMPKFHLLHLAFPGLKMTSNFDSLLENNTPGPHVKVCYGDQAGELDWLFTHIDKNSLLKIHGGLRDIHSIMLSSSQYADIYGDSTGFDPNAPLPLFLKRVFTNCSLLFIGCSLALDRTRMIMENLKGMRPHFAIMREPEQEHEWAELNQRLSNSGITPIWITDFGQIEEILQQLVEPAEVQPKPTLIEPGIPFVGRIKELEQIREDLEKVGDSGNIQVITGQWFNIKGVGGIGKTILAIEAAQQFSGLTRFKDGVLAPLRVADYTPMSFAMHLAGAFQLKITEPPDPEAAQRQVTDILKKRQALLILDNAPEWKNLRYMLPNKTRSAVLITTRNQEIPDLLRHQFPGLQVREITLEPFTNKEALELFQLMLGGKYRANLEDIYLEIAKNLGFLPIALRQAVSLMLFGPRYSAPGLRDKLVNEDRLELLCQGKETKKCDRLTIESLFDLSSPLLTGVLLETLEYLAACSPGPVALDFLQQLTKDEDIEERLERLCAFSWCECRKIGDEQAYELHRLVRELVRARFENRFQENFIQLVHDIYTDNTIHFSIKEKFYLQLEEALSTAAENGDERLKEWLYDLYDFCTLRGFTDFYNRLIQWVEALFPEDQRSLKTVYAYRALKYSRDGKLEEAMKFLQEEEKICEQLNDRAGLAACYGNQALILSDWGKLPEAMDLHKKEEKIEEELHNRKGLAQSYGNQALILSDWGKLPEAMDLHKKEEKIYKELSDRAGLAACYGNQALILFDWGKLPEAMDLHKKEEKIEKEMDNRKGWAQSYGNQALILKTLGKLPEAMDLHKKEEKIKEELGDRAGLATCYGNQAVILKKRGKLQKAMTFLKKQEKIREELGDRAGLAACYSNQALILKARGKLAEAMDLHKKEEKICEELGDRAGLAACYGNQALILKTQEKLQEAMALYKKQEKIKEELGDRAKMTRDWWNQGLIYNKKRNYKKQSKSW